MFDYKDIDINNAFDIPRKIEFAEFTDKILNKLQREDYKNFLQACYEYNNSNKYYFLKKDTTPSKLDKISDILNSIDYNFLNEYKINIEYFGYEIYKLCTRKYILEKIYYFPFDLFGDGENDFMGIVFDSLYELFIIITFRLTENAALPNFKNSICVNLKNEYKYSYNKYLEENQFVKNIDSIQEKTNLLRNKALTHNDKDYINGTLIINRLPWNEIVEIEQNLYNCFNCLTFGVEYAKLPRLWDGSNNSDIERIFDNIVKESFSYNLPEKSSASFEYKYKIFTEKEKKIYNAYRTKLGKTSFN